MHHAAKFVVPGIFALLLAACSSSATAPQLPNSTTQRPGNSNSTLSVVAAARVFPGPAVPVCGLVAAGFARCHAWVRTDITGKPSPNAAPSGYGPSDLQTAYALTTASKNNGSGVTVAIVDAFDDPNAESDLGVYRSQFGLTPCTTANGCFTKVKFGNRTNTGWAEEESLDVDMVSAICPNCKIQLVEAATNSTANLVTAENWAVSHGASAVSNSWSGNESSNTSNDGPFKTAGVEVTASTGDSGFNSTAQWPAIIPQVTGVGGTSLTSISPRAESAWSGAGSACSAVYSEPSYQSGVISGCSKRASADVSADADPNTGVAVYDTFRVGGWLVFGGTSVSSPIIASVYGLAGNASTAGSGYPYAHRTSLNDVTTGSNGSCGTALCNAGAGWDGPTGLGTPIGTGAF
jgi:subtilase family serine protease